VGVVAEEHVDFYAELGVSPDASPAEIAHAYRSLLREHHPDTQTGVPASPPERLRRILAAYAVLRDPTRRATYDAERAASSWARTRTAPAPSARWPAGSGTGSAIWAGPVRWHPSPGYEPAAVADEDELVLEMVVMLRRLFDPGYRW
jgi:curved DNA-binding protein CbpA